MAESNFDRLKGSIEKKEGYSAKEAAATAADIGRKKFGAEGMAEKAAAGRRASTAALSAYAKQRAATLSRGSKRCT